MISLLLNSTRKVIDSVIKPSTWTVDNANGIAGQVNYPRVAFESTILKHQMRSIDPVNLSVMCSFQYQVNFRFASTLKYDQLPLRELTDILSYLSFIFSIHPTILEKTADEIDALSVWQYPSVDPCLYDRSQSRYTIQKSAVNGFVPVIELTNTDWVIVLVMSFEIELEASKSEYRKYFAENLTTQIDSNPALIGGTVGEIDRVKLDVWDKRTDTLAAQRTIRQL